MKNELDSLTREELINKIEELKSDKKYGLIWEDQKEEVEYELENNYPILREVKDKEIKTDKTKPTNLLIEGDNIHSLNTLLYTHKEKVDVIYIDPPYNTGNKDFIYNDKMVDKEDTWRHSKWLSFMNKRLKIARELLKDDGVIFISIDEYEYAQLKLLCDNIFGEMNFIANIVWDKRNPKGNSNTISSVTEYILCFSKDKTRVKKMNVKKENSAEMIRQSLKIFKSKNKNLKQKNEEFQDWLKLKPFLAGEKAYRFIDKNGKLYRPVSLAAPTNSLNNYVVEHPITLKPCKLPKKGLRVIEETFEKLLSEDRILFGVDETTIPNRKYLLEENMFMTLTDLISYAGNGIDDLTKLNFSSDVFNNPKPVYLIKKLLECINKNAIVLDFFAGSGTTGHAVLDLNEEDGGNRQFILCTNNENNICTDVTYQRLNKVINGYTTPKGVEVDGLGGNLKYYQTAFVSKKDELSKTKEKNDLSIEMADNSTELLCIKENCFNLHILNEERDYKIFNSNDKVMAIYMNYIDGKVLDFIVETLLEQPQKNKILYLLEGTAHDGEEDVVNIKEKGIQIEFIPEKIMKIYESSLKNK